MIKPPSSRPAMVGLLAMALILVGFPSNDAGAHKTKTVRATTAVTQQQKPEKPIKLRYYGGPKSPMYPG